MKSLVAYPPAYIVLGSLLALLPLVRETFWLGTLILGGLIGVYAFLAKKEAEKSSASQGSATPPSEINRVGDNCYFIGFVYTLVVVAVTLAPPLPTTESGQYDIEPLVSAVAIALSTSVIGMVLRFVIVEKLEDKEDKLGDMIAELSQNVSRVSGTARELNSVVGELRDTVNTSRDSFKKAADQAELCADALHGVLDKAKNSMDAAVQDLFKTFSEKITEVFSAEPFDAIRQQLEATIRQNDDVAAELKKKIEEAFSNMKSAVDVIASRSAQMEQSMEKIAKMADSSEWQKTVRALSDFADKMEQVRQSTKGVSDETGEYAVAMGRARSALDKHAAEIEKDVEKMAKIKEEYRKAHEAAAKAAIEETQKLYAELIVGARAALANSKELEDLAKNLKIVANNLERQ